MRTSLAVFLGCTLLAGTPLALHANGGGTMSMPSVRPETPLERAKSLYNEGVRLVKRGDGAKTAEKARVAYGKAVEKFTGSTGLAPDLHEAWNYLGYSYRKLGDAAAALDAYDRALALKPDYANAIEYRGQAYLALGRLDDAKGAYLALYPANARLADQLLAAMRDWVQTQRQSPGSVPAAAVDEFGQWVDERARLATSTASLTREGSPAPTWQ